MTDDITFPKIRPSALPKLALCGQFQSAPGESAAANRGSEMDYAFRTANFGQLNQEEIEAVKWALSQVDAAGETRFTMFDPESCWLPVECTVGGGTVDAINRKLCMSWDLKSGQVYDYRAQMAAYALAAMVDVQTDTWTTVLLFCDQRKVVAHDWTLATARHAVDVALTNIGKPPTPNEFCTWCAHATTCEPRIRAQESALQTRKTSFLEIIQDPQKLGAFLDACVTLDDFRETAKERAKELLEAGTEVPGWRLGKGRQTRTVTVSQLLEVGVDLETVLEVAGSISLAKADELAPGTTWAVEVKTSKAPLIREK
jgi:hypothetical protein